MRIMRTDTVVNEWGTRAFWRRQFQGPRTRPQRIFDLIAGLLLPVVCLTLDPILFGRARSSFLSPLAPEHRAFAWSFIGMEVLVFSVWLFAPALARRAPAAFAGFLLAGAAVAFSLGLLLLPLSVIGAFYMGIGLLGLSPFVTGLAFLRNGLQALAAARARGRPMVLWLCLCWGAVLAIAPPAFLEGQLRGRCAQAIRDVVDGSPAQQDAALRTLRLVCWGAGVMETSALVRAYDTEIDFTDPESARREGIAAAYRILTGEDIEQAWRD